MKKNVKIKLEMDYQKASALSYFLRKNGTSIEQELTQKLNELYIENVSEEMRGFLDMQDAEEEKEEEAEVSEDKPKRAYKKKDKKIAEETSQESAVENSEEVVSASSMKLS